MKKNVTISLILGIAISGVALFFAFRQVPFAELINELKSINYFWVIPSAMVVILSFIIRAFRWQIILESVEKIPFWRAFHPLMIGFMLNCIFPARLGEAARPAILQLKDKVSFPTGLATVAAERVFDLIILAILFTGVLSFVEIDSGLDIPFGKYHLNKNTLEIIFSGIIKLCGILMIGIILISVNKTRKIVTNSILGAPAVLFFVSSHVKDILQQKICKPLAGIVESFATGFSLIKDPVKICICFGLSFLIWVLAALSYYIMALGCPGTQGLSFFAIFAVMIIICFFIALPSVPGFWGLWEAGGIFALNLFGVAQEDAAGYTLVNHAVQMIPVIIVGIVSAVIYGINIRKIPKAIEK